MAFLLACAAPAVFAYEWEPITTSIKGVGVEVNIFNVAPCAVVIDAAGVKVNRRTFPALSEHHSFACNPGHARSLVA